MQAPIYTDTEPETSLDAEVSLKDIEKNQNANFTKSVFNLTLANFTESHESTHFRDHESKLESEIREWKNIWKDAKQQLKAVQNTKETVDISALPAQKRAYLQQAPNLQRFIRKSMEFRKAANVFLRVDLAEALNMVENLTEICEYRSDVMKENITRQLLANVSNSRRGNGLCE